MITRYLPVHFLLGTLLCTILSGTTGPEGYVVGSKAKDFSLKNVDGKMVSLASFKGVKGYIVVFTCNHCPYAQVYEQRIIDLHRKYEPLGYPVVAINPNSPSVVPEDSYEEMCSRAARNSYPFVYLFDEQQTVFPEYGATRTPHVFLLDSSLTVRYIGAIDDNPENIASIKHHYVEEAIAALEKGEKPNPDFTKAIGCPVKKVRTPKTATAPGVVDPNKH